MNFSKMNSPKAITEFLHSMRQRGVISEILKESALIDAIGRRAAVYCGFDASKSTLHVGHLVQLKLLQKLIKLGCPAVVVVGQPTALIGDPSFRTSRRKTLAAERVEQNGQNIKKQLAILLPQAKVITNQEWYESMNVIDFLTNVGQSFTVNKMLERKGIKIEARNDFLTFSQFAYILLQAYDFAHLWKKENCQIQIGGSDQMPNIAFGLDLIRKQYGSDSQASGVTTALLTNKDGAKLAKTGSRQDIFLDETVTSIFRFYQFIINRSDEEALAWLKIFGDQSDSTANFAHSKAQERLAQVLIAWVHTQDKWTQFARIPEIIRRKNLFVSDLCPLKKEEWALLARYLPILPKKEQDISLVQYLKTHEVVDSVSDGTRLLKQNGIRVRCAQADAQATTEQQLDQSHEPWILLRKGKQNFYLIKNN